MGSTRKPCLAACEDQVNLVTETSSSFPNSETFHRREEFCLIVNKLIRTCSTKKSAALTDKFPYICQHLSMIQNKERKAICPLGKWNPSVDHPELMVNSTQDTTKSVAELIRTEMFQYAKSNMALVNVYIKVSSLDQEFRMHLVKSLKHVKITVSKGCWKIKVSGFKSRKIHLKILVHRRLTIVYKYRQILNVI